MSKMTGIVLLFIFSQLFANNARALQLVDNVDCLQNQISPERVVYGKEGHMFIVSQDFREEFPVEQTLPLFLAVSQSLNKQGIKLVVVPIAHKGIVDVKYLNRSDLIQREYNWLNARTAYRHLISGLKDSGVISVDTLSVATAFKNPFYNLTDWHWKSEGARLIAEKTAKTIKELPVYIGLPKKLYNTVQLSSIELDGGSAYYSSQIEKRCNTKVTTHENINIFKTQAVEESNNLLGDEQPDVILVGTSFSAAPWNFEGFLKQSLGTDVLNVATIGGGVNSSIQSYLLSDTFKLHKPKIIIWEYDFDRLYDNDLEKKQWSQLMAMVDADCTSASGVLKTKISYPVTLINLGGQFSSKIIHLKFSDLSLRFFDFESSANNQTKTTQQAGRWDFITNTGDYYFKTDNIDRFKISIPKFQENVNGEVSVSLCKYY